MIPEQHDQEYDNDLPEDGDDDLAARVAELESALLQVREEQMRERAELDNQRKRLIREAEQTRRFANEKLLADLLPVFDSLEAGLAAEGEVGKLREGMELTLRQLRRVAENSGLLVVDPAGQAFDPAQHEAMSMIPSEGSAPGSVLQVYQKGYVLNDRLLRPALVVVAGE